MLSQLFPSQLIACQNDPFHIFGTTLCFGVVPALTAGIGGPSHSVGDLSYTSCLAFLVSLGIAMTCYSEIERDELTWGALYHIIENHSRDALMDAQCHVGV